MDTRNYNLSLAIMMHPKGFTLMEMVVTIVITLSIVMLGGYLLTFGVKNMMLAPELADIDSETQLFLDRFTRDVRRTFPTAGQAFTGSSTTLTIIDSDISTITYELVNEQILRTATNTPQEAILSHVSAFNISYYDANGQSVVLPSSDVRLFKITVSITNENITRQFETTVFPMSWRLADQ